jgi:broad specificity phosphatase PhoE
MPVPSSSPAPRLLYLARHAETVYNANARMQGRLRHTPLTRAGFAQADAMGRALLEHLGPKPDIALWCSSAGRTQQTTSVICEHLGLDFFSAEVDDRLQEIDVGQWEGRSYAAILAEIGPFVCEERRLFTQRPPGGEWYDEMAARLHDWLVSVADEPRPVVAIAHGVSSRVLRGLIVGGEPYGAEAVRLPGDWPQGTILRIEAGQETPLLLGTGQHAPRARVAEGAAV